MTILRVSYRSAGFSSAAKACLTATAISNGNSLCLLLRLIARHKGIDFSVRYVGRGHHTDQGPDW